MKLLDNLSLGKKTTLLTVIGLVFGASVFSFLAIRAVNQATEAMLQDRLTTARLVADHIDESIGHALAELQYAGNMIYVDGPQADIADRISALEATYSRLEIYTYGFYILDASGRIIWGRPGGQQLDGTSMASQPGISQTLQTGQPGVSGLSSAPVTGAPVIFLASPDGDNRGAIVAAIDITQSSIGGFVKPIRLGQTGYVEIVDQNGVVIARTEPGPTLAPFEKSDHSGRFAALIAAGEPTRGLCHTCHEPAQKVETRDVLAFAPLARAEWGAVIRQSEGEAMAPIRELRQSLLVSGAGLLAIAFLVVIVTTRGIVGHIRMLTASSQKIAGGDLTSPVTSSRKDEMGLLALAFDKMRSRLKDSYGELEQRTEELTSLLSVSDILTSLPDLSNLDAALGSALDKTLETMKGDAGAILLRDREKRRLRYRAHRGLSAESRKAAYLREGGLAGRVARTGETIIIDDVSAEAVHSGLNTADRIRALVGAPLRFKDDGLGVIYIASHEPGRFSARNVQLLEGIARQIATAIENAELHQEVQQKESVRGELLREIYSIQEEERKRIARELHDETSQSLASLNASLEVAVGMLPTSIDRARDILRKSQSLSIDILDEIHKMIYELRPTMLDDLGLVSAIGWLVDNKLGDAGVAVDFKTVGQERRLSPQMDTTLFRVIQEAVSNIARHSHARHARIRLHFKKRSIEANIRDDGDGFDVDEAIRSKERPRGLGLLGMKERVELMSGSLQIRSQPGGGGTEVEVKIPLKSEV